MPLKTLPKFASQFVKRDVVKIICLVLALLGTVSTFIISPVLSKPLLISIVATLVLSPIVATFERRGYSRSLAIGMIFSVAGIVVGSGGYWLTHSLIKEWDSFRVEVPKYFNTTVDRIRAIESDVETRYPILEGANPTASLIKWAESTGQWFLTNGTSLIGDLLTAILIVPLLTFFLLRDGRTLRKKMFDLVPNRYFENSVIVFTKIVTSFSDYIRAKLLEAFLVGLLTLVGLMVVGSPYSVVLAIISGATNIIPYAGPVMGAVPAILIVMSDPNLSHLLWPVIAVYAIANIIDMALIFPLMVAKLVNLHPMLLIIVVMIGQQYYGLIGMLISIPVATGLKVVLQEVYSAVYEQGSSRRTSVPV